MTRLAAAAISSHVGEQALGLEHCLGGHGGLLVGSGLGQILGGLGLVGILLVAELCLQLDERLAGRVAGGAKKTANQKRPDRLPCGKPTGWSPDWAVTSAEPATASPAPKASASVCDD